MAKKRKSTAQASSIGHTSLASVDEPKSQTSTDRHKGPANRRERRASQKEFATPATKDIRVSSGEDAQSPLSLDEHAANTIDGVDKRPGTKAGPAKEPSANSSVQTSRGQATIGGRKRQADRLESADGKKPRRSDARAGPTDVEQAHSVGSPLALAFKGKFRGLDPSLISDLSRTKQFDEWLADRNQWLERLLANASETASKQEYLMNRREDAVQSLQKHYIDNYTKLKVGAGMGDPRGGCKNGGNKSQQSIQITLQKLADIGGKITKAAMDQCVISIKLLVCRHDISILRFAKSWSVEDDQEPQVPIPTNS